MNFNLIPIGSFIAIIAATILVAYLVNRFFNRLIRRSMEEQNTDPTNYKFLRHVVVALVHIVGFGIAIYSVPQLKTLASSLLAGAGIFALAISFASQQALSNVISGIFIIIFKPFRVNDRLNIKEFVGIVEDITLRHTVIRDFENKRIIIPNSVISNDVIVNSNFADDQICKWIDVRIGFDSSIADAKQILLEEIKNHPFYLDPRTPEQKATGVPEVVVRVLSWGEYAINIRVWAWTKDAPSGFVLSCDVLESVKNRFEKEGIEIPFPHRTVVHKSMPKF